jgi:hypothetical protein
LVGRSVGRAFACVLQFVTTISGMNDEDTEELVTQYD